MPDPETLTLPADAEAPDYAHGSVFFIGTATVILRYAGFTILTDPNFLHAGDHAHLGYGLRSERLTDPAIDVGDLPPLDFLVLSHFHGDHFDRVAAKKLDKNLPIVTTPHAAKALQRLGFRNTRALDTWQPLEVTKGDAKVTVTAMPGRHGPPVVAAALPPVMGSMLDFQAPTGRAPALRLYVSGDTLVHEDVKEIPHRFPGVDLALLHLGGTRVLGILVTMDAKQGVQMIRIIDPETAIPIHYDDYTVFKSPLADFQKAVREAGLADRVHYLRHGETYGFEVDETRRT